MVTRLAGSIFEGLPKELSDFWPERFADAPKEGADLSLIGYKFMYWNLTENLVLKDSDDMAVQAVIIQCRNVIKQCAEAICPLTKGEKFDENAARSAANAAESAARSAASGFHACAGIARPAASVQNSMAPGRAREK